MNVPHLHLERPRRGSPGSTKCAGGECEAADQANVICFLASSHADFVTGLTIDVTGGL